MKLQNINEWVNEMKGQYYNFSIKQYVVSVTYSTGILIKGKKVPDGWKWIPYKDGFADHTLTKTIYYKTAQEAAQAAFDFFGVKKTVIQKGNRLVVK